MNIYLAISLIAIGAMSLATFITYAIDKHKARRGKWRIPEKVLLLMSLFGGALGATIGMYTIRHKNRKWYFVVVNIMSLLLHIALLIWLLTVIY